MPYQDVMHKWGKGELHSGSKTGPVVKNQRQAVAIMLSEKRHGEKADGGPALGIATRQFGGGMGPGSMQQYAEHQEMRGLMGGMMHTGPIMSAVPGRTDRHPMNVGSSSYVMPADAVSHLGQNNTLAGMSVLNRMFKMGPYGSGGVGLQHHSMMPRPPKAAPLMDKGGARGNDHKVGAPTPVETAGGEFVIPPEKIMQFFQTGPEGLPGAHKALDQWVLKLRKDHLKTLKGLPPPTKD